MGDPYLDTVGELYMGATQSNVPAETLQTMGGPLALAGLDADNIRVQPNGTLGMIDRPRSQEERYKMASEAWRRHAAGIRQWMKRDKMSAESAAYYYIYGKTKQHYDSSIAKLNTDLRERSGSLGNKPNWMYNLALQDAQQQRFTEVAASPLAAAFVVGDDLFWRTMTREGRNASPEEVAAHFAQTIDDDAWVLGPATMIEQAGTAIAARSALPHNAPGMGNPFNEIKERHVIESENIRRSAQRAASELSSAELAAERATGVADRGTRNYTAVERGTGNNGAGLVDTGLIALDEASLDPSKPRSTVANTSPQPSPFQRGLAPKPSQQATAQHAPNAAQPSALQAKIQQLVDDFYAKDYAQGLQDTPAGRRALGNIFQRTLGITNSGGRFTTMQSRAASSELMTLVRLLKDGRYESIEAVPSSSAGRSADFRGHRHDGTTQEIESTAATGAKKGEKPYTGPKGQGQRPAPHVNDSDDAAFQGVLRKISRGQLVNNDLVVVDAMFKPREAYDFANRLITRLNDYVTANKLNLTQLGEIEFSTLEARANEMDPLTKGVIRAIRSTGGKYIIITPPPPDVPITATHNSGSATK